MTNIEETASIENIVKQFNFEGELIDYVAYGNGHINDTYMVRFKKEDGTGVRYILQRVNTNIFKQPREVMENIEAVTLHLKEQIIARGGDPLRETLNAVKTVDNKVCYEDKIHGFWKAYLFIEGSLAIEIVENESHFYQSALAFGAFQAALHDFPAEKLHATIPDFHNTPKRFKTFIDAVVENSEGRAQDVQEEINFVKDREAFTHTLRDLHEQGLLSLKVSHNDTKLNNVLFDKETELALCVVDLDTVMPGFALDDFGDSIRFGATSSAEDETDLSKVNFQLNLYDLYTKGFLEGAQGILSAVEVEHFPEGAKMMTLECGMRFLTDYLQGDVYFKTDYPSHNLDRARNQFKLVSDMESVWDEMKAVSKKYI